MSASSKQVNDKDFIPSDAILLVDGLWYLHAAANADDIVEYEIKCLLRQSIAD